MALQFIGSKTAEIPEPSGSVMTAAAPAVAVLDPPAPAPAPAPAPQPKRRGRPPKQHLSGATGTPPVAMASGLPPAPPVAEPLARQAHLIEEWTNAEWDMLVESASTLVTMVTKHPAVNNKAWRTQLRVAIRTIATFDGSVER